MSGDDTLDFIVKGIVVVVVATGLSIMVVITGGFLATVGCA